MHDRCFTAKDEMPEFRNECFEECTFTGIDFTGTPFTNALVEGTEFQDCTFTNCDFTGVEWYGGSGFIHCTWTDGTPGLVDMADERAHIQEMAAQVLGHPEAFNMLSWESWAGNCRTTRCMGGWLLHLDGQTVNDSTGPADTATRATRLAPHAAVHFWASDENALRWLETQVRHG